MIEELPNPYDEETFRQWVEQEKGKTWWFQYKPGGLFFVYDSYYGLVGVIDKDVVRDVLGNDKYHRIRGGVTPLVEIVL